MKTMLHLLTQEVKTAFENAGYPSDNVEVSMSRRPELCDFQCNSAMRLAKQAGVKPLDIATQVADLLQDSDMIGTVEAQAPGFINLKISQACFVERLGTMTNTDKLGFEQTDKPKNIILDFGGANVAKSLHVGHLRSAVIGESLIRLLRFKGHQVTGDMHLGDWGLQMGLVIEKLRLEQPDLPYYENVVHGAYPKEAPFSIQGLTSLYTGANILSKEDPDFRKKAAQSTAELQQGRAGYRALWKHILETSKEDLRKNYASLQVHFDLWLGESDADPAVPRVLAELDDQGLLKESKGAKVVFVDHESDKKPMPPCILQKENGAVLYATTDLATIYQRMQDKPDQIIYVVDKRQGLHFDQVFRVARMAGITPETTDLKHIGFGTMNGKDGKPFKTRDGGVMALEDLICILIDGVRDRLKDQNRLGDQEAIDQTALQVGVGALKYGDLCNLPERDYVFDLDKFGSFEGKTGPYIQYAVVRITSILEKLSAKGLKAASIKSLVTDAERDLALQLATFNDWADLAVENYQPSRICDYAFDLAQKFNRFYHDVHIVSEDNMDRQQELMALLVLTKEVLKTSLDLLGIRSLDKM